jgi:hypothetical protein
VLDVGPSAGDRWRVTSAASIDATNRSATFLGHPLLLVVRNRQLFRVPLALGGAVAPVAVQPTLADICTLQRVLELDTRTGSDAWVEVERAGADGDCSLSGDNPTDWVRAATGEVRSPRLATTTVLVDTLYAETGALQHVLVHDVPSSELRLLDPQTLADRGASGAVSGGAPVNEIDPFASEAGSVTARHYRIGRTTLRRLAWDAAGATLSPVLHTFIGTPVEGVADASHLYFGDGRDLRRIAGGAASSTSHALLAPGDGDITEIDLTDNHVLVAQGLFPPRLLSVRKDNGAARTALAGGPADPGPYLFVGHRGDTVTIADLASGGTSGRLFRTDAATPIGAAAVSGISLAGVVLGRTIRSDSLATDAVVYCVPAVAGAPDCRGGTLREFDVASGAVRTLGALPAWSSLSSVTLFTLGWSGLPSTLSSSALVGTAPAQGRFDDVFLFSPGESGSLSRVTTLAP